MEQSFFSQQSPISRSAYLSQNVFNTFKTRKKYQETLPFYPSDYPEGSIVRETLPFYPSDYPEGSIVQETLPFYPSDYPEGGSYLYNPMFQEEKNKNLKFHAFLDRQSRMYGYDKGIGSFGSFGNY